MGNCFTFCEPLTFKFSFDVSHITDFSTFPEQTGTFDIGSALFQIRDIIGGKMEYAAGFENSGDLHHKIGTEEPVSFMFCFWPRIGAEQVEPVERVVRENDGDQMSGFHTEEKG